MRKHARHLGTGGITPEVSFNVRDLVKIRIRDLAAGPEIRTRAIAVQQKTARPVHFEITTEVRASLLAWLEWRGGTVDDFARLIYIVARTRQAASAAPKMPLGETEQEAGTGNR
ncbi:hypothetical protein OF122_12640 [Pelagibacterium flavum]|uniref:Integrase n=1 Tax=Pelagibacterium flavum TaxID=2984530 RepID=A0ABY6IJX2_9HYPH|nr:hypothetical protein [Pelagibacterium sp. YIM 151497]UYQ70908.1 hypothetical protein OF122_12640 [Pelagibacterium sp. YIM 151497]